MIGATPTPSDPAYATKIVQFVQDQAPDTFEGEPVNFGQTFSTTVTAQDAPDAPDSIAAAVRPRRLGRADQSAGARPEQLNFIYQRFQRGIMHYDKGCGCTQGLLLADYLKSVITGQNLPTDLAAQVQTSKYYKQYAPGKPGSLARPNDLPGSDLTNAFDQQQPSAAAAHGTTPATPTAHSQARRQPAGLCLRLPGAHCRTSASRPGVPSVGNVKLAGFGWVKHQIEWLSVETDARSYDWSELDAIVNADQAPG